MKWWEWVFSGIGVLGLGLLIEWLRRRLGSSPQSASITAQGAKVTDSPVASGRGIVQTVNSPTINVSLPAPAPGTPGNERYNEWRELISEIHESLLQISSALPLRVRIFVRPGHVTDYEEGFARGYRVLQSRILIADVLENAGMLKKFYAITDYALSAGMARKPSQPDCPTIIGFCLKAHEFEDELMELARRDSSSRSTQAYESLTPDERKAIKRKLAVSRINAWHPRLTVWVTNRSSLIISAKSASMWHGEKRLTSGSPSEGRKAVEVRANSENIGMAFTTDDDAMLKLQSLGVVDKHLPTYSFSGDVDMEVRIEYEVLGVEDEFRETIRVRVHGNRQIESL